MALQAPRAATSSSTPIIRATAAQRNREEKRMTQTPQQHNQGPIDVVIMAAGKGTRMKSKLPKVLHRLGGRALLAHVAGTAARIGARNVVFVTGHGAAEVEAAMASFAGGMPGATQRFARQE